MYCFYEGTFYFQIQEGLREMILAFQTTLNMKMNVHAFILLTFWNSFGVSTLITSSIVQEYLVCKIPPFWKYHITQNMIEDIIANMYTSVEWQETGSSTETYQRWNISTDIIASVKI